MGGYKGNRKWIEGDWSVHYNTRKRTNGWFPDFIELNTSPFYLDPSMMIDMMDASVRSGPWLDAPDICSFRRCDHSRRHPHGIFWAAATPGNRPFRITAVVVQQDCLGTSAAPRAHFRAFGPLATLSPRGRTLIHARARTRPRT